MQEHYDETAKHRKLTWIHTLGSIIVKTQLKNRTTEMTMAPIQAVVLMLFNNRMPYSTITFCTAHYVGMHTMTIDLIV